MTTEMNPTDDRPANYEHPDLTASHVANTSVMALYEAGVRFRLNIAWNDEEGEALHGHMVIQVPHPTDPDACIEYQFPMILTDPGEDERADQTNPEGWNRV